MIETLALVAVLLLQDPPATPATVEDRLRQLDLKVADLEKKQAALTRENAVLAKQIADRAAARESFLRQAASAWITTYAQAAQLSEKQSRDCEELFYGWGKEDLEKPVDLGRWKAREEVLRGRLGPDQASRLGRKVREVQEQGAKMTLGLFVGQSLGPEKGAMVEKAVLKKLSLDDQVLLPQAHPEKTPSWMGILGALEGCLPELKSTLSEPEFHAIQKMIVQWKPDRR